MNSLGKIPTICHVCGSENLEWDCCAQNHGCVQDGRISMSEVGVVFFLGCNECSETLKIVDGDEVAQVLNNIK